MSITSVIFIAVVATLALVGIVTAIVKAHKSAGNTIPWEAISPILTEVFTEIVKIQAADKMGYDALENYAVNYVKGKIDASTFLTQEEKAFFTADLIRSLISPKLKELYNNTAKG